MNRLEELRYYMLSMQLWDECWGDTEKMLSDIRGREICRQLIRSVGSISANIEEGYGRGFGKEYSHFLKISRGSARESRGWYLKSKFLLKDSIITSRTATLDSIISMLTSAINTLEKKNIAIIGK
ncbi:MAG: four helix bundle protein [Bacteroidetes bacterium]|nr:four helix bundle protein [Bacteroidota bacterium]MBL0138285.1 four helix bundle protein [Bacteroidota bacterium]